MLSGLTFKSLTHDSGTQQLPWHHSLLQGPLDAQMDGSLRFPGVLRAEVLLFGDGWSVSCKSVN